MKEKIEMRNKRWAAGIRTAALAAAAAALMAGTVMAAGKSGDNRDLVTGPGALVQETGSFDADRFVLPQEAKVLVVVQREVPAMYMPLNRGKPAGSCGCRPQAGLGLTA